MTDVSLARHCIRHGNKGLPANEYLGSKVGKEQKMNKKHIHRHTKKEYIATYQSDKKII